MQANTFEITLEDAEMISPHVKHFYFKTITPHVLNYQAGQFITIYFDYKNQSFHRSYSIANAPNQNGLVEFAASYIQDGPGSEFLFNHLKPGQRVNARGPFGRLLLQASPPKRYIFIATSTGVTPFRAMLPELKHQLAVHPSCMAVLLHGIKTPADMIYHDEFLDFTHQSAQFSYRAYISQEQIVHFEDAQYAGHVQDAFPSLNLDADDDLIYLCGNPNMIDSAFSLLKDRAFAPQRIIREKYISR